MNALRRAWRRLTAWVSRRGRAVGRWHAFDVAGGAPGWPGLLRWPRKPRRCALYQPGSLRDGEPAPLVLLLHGCRQEAVPFARASGWVRAAEQGRFRLLCPQQSRWANPFGCWNWFTPAAQRGRGEVEVVVRAVADALARVPTTQVAAVGLSAGGALAALLAFHHADRFAAVVTVAAPPLLGPMNLQDPRDVMKRGLLADPLGPTQPLKACAPLCVVQGAADDVVVPRCAEQLAAQAEMVLQRAHGPLTARTGSAHAADQWAATSLVLRVLRLPGLGHVWSGAPGGHAYVSRDGPALTELAVAFLSAAGALRRG